jgi:hypothetical protein
MPWRWTDPLPKESYQMSKGSISKKNLMPDKGIRKNEKERRSLISIFTFAKYLILKKLECTDIYRFK